MHEDFAARLAERVARTGPAVVGLDPRVDALPDAVAPGQPPAARILAFYRLALEVLADHVAAVKPNIAFFELFGSAGFAAYEATCELARQRGLLVIGDVKRGDIGATAEAYAEIHLRLADAVTLNPYLGTDSVAPFLARCRDAGGGVFVLVRTSNPSATELQDLAVGSETVCDAVARLVDRWGQELGDRAGYSPVGAVVGATRPQDLARLRRLLPRAWLLLPGVGAQGGRIEDTAAAFDAAGRGGLISQSRSIMQCFAPADPRWRDALAAAAAGFAEQARRAASNGTRR
jgi:orotidine-5'-phosphate decarboxylase